jgi:PIN domain nuclease of toxin-antitoxin system
MILLDTCGLLVLPSGGVGLSAEARRRLEAPGSRVFISAISAFEIGQKHAAGRLILKKPPALWYPAMLRHHDITELPVTSSHVLAATALPPLHKDPFDRLIIAAALEGGFEILTFDTLIMSYPGVRTLW